MARRRTLALFIEATSSRRGEYQSELCRGVADAAKRHGVNLLCVAGGALEHSPTVPYDHLRNVAYELTKNQPIDGIVISGTVGSYMTRRTLSDFCKEYDTQRLVTTVEAIRGVPAVCIDDAVAFRRLLEHLIVDHGYRRIAFIRGPAHNPEAEIRFKVYLEQLEEHQIERDDHIIADGDFFPASGAAALAQLLDGQNSGFRALVAANDNMAIGALREAQHRGILVPKQLAIVGFDDIEESTATSPALTTGRHPIYKQGWYAAETILARLDGKPTPPLQNLDTVPCIRQSCGCDEWSNELTDPTMELPEALPSLSKESNLARAEILDALGDPKGQQIAAETQPLLQAYHDDLKGSAESSLLSRLDAILSQTVLSGNEIFPWHRAIEILRHHTQAFPLTPPDRMRMASLWRKAHIKIANAAWQAEAFRRLSGKQRAEMIAEMHQSLVTASSEREVAVNLARVIPKLGVRSCCLRLYDDPDRPTAGARVILEPDSDGSSVPPSRFDSQPAHASLIPDAFNLSERPFALVLEPLYFHEHQLGYAILDADVAEWGVCEILQEELSYALWTFDLLRRQRESLEKEKHLQRMLDEVQEPLQLERVAKAILVELEKLVGFTNASVQLVTGNHRALLAAHGANKAKEQLWFHPSVSADPLILRVVRGNAPVILRYTASDPDWKKNEVTADVQSWIGLPLTYGNSVIAVVTMDHTQAGYFSEKLDVELRRFGHKAAIGLQHALEFSVTRDRVEQLEIINALAMMLANQVGPGEFLRRMAQSVSQYLASDRLGVFLPSQPEGEPRLAPAAAFGTWTAEDTARVTCPDGIVSVAYARGESMPAGKRDAEERPNAGSDGRDLRSSSLASPIKSGSRTIGVLCAESVNANWFDTAKLRFLETVASQCAISIESSSSLEILLDIGSRVADLQNLQQLMMEVVLGAIKLTRCTTGVIYIFDESGSKIIGSFCPPGFTHPAPRLDEGVSLTRCILESRQPIPILDVGNDDRVNPILKAEFASMIGLPFAIQRRVVGVMYLNDRIRHHFSEMELFQLRILASQAAIAIESASLLEKERLRVEELNTVLDGQKLTMDVQERLVRLMSQQPSQRQHPDAKDGPESRDSLLQKLMLEILKWPGVADVEFCDPDASREYGLENYDTLSEDDRLRVAAHLAARFGEPLELDSGVRVSFVKTDGPAPRLLLVRLDPARRRDIFPWLRMADLVLDYWNDILELVQEAKRLRDESEQRIAQALVGTVSRLFGHEALNAVKAIESWIDNSRRESPNLDALARRVELLRQNVESLMSVTDFARKRRRRCVLGEELNRALKYLNMRNGAYLDGCQLECAGLDRERSAVNIDPNSLTPILNNLILNAREQYRSLGRAGRIVISIEECQLGRERYVGFGVRDYARGISEETRKKLFTPGFSTKRDGQGLGLAIVSKLVDANEGRVLVDSTFGHFTQFSVMYPVIE